MNTVLDFLERSAAVYPDREAYEDEKKLLTFAQTRDLARAVGTALQEKIRPDKKPVVVYLDKSVECIVPSLEQCTAVISIAPWIRRCPWSG